VYSRLPRRLHLAGTVDVNLTGWLAWSKDLANMSRIRYEAKTARQARLKKEEEDRFGSARQQE